MRFENKQVIENLEVVIKHIEDFILKRKDEQKR